MVSTLIASEHRAIPETGMVPTSEIFGPVWQGEGPFTGRVCYFLRLGLCNLHCSWCDTAYTWDESRFDVHAECPPRSTEEIVAMLPKAGLIILSGGEPMIHQYNRALRMAFENPRLEVQVETNGTLAPSDWARERISHFTVSPKLGEQGDPLARRIRPEVLAEFAELARAGRAIFKIVVRDEHEVDLAWRFFQEHEVPQAGRWVMPEGVTGDVVLSRARALGDHIASRGLNLTLRQQVLLYGMERRR